MLQQQQHAPHGGATGENDRHYTGGEFLPFYKPRTLMPQVDDKAYPALRLWLTDHAITQLSETVEPWQLHPHQRIDAMKAHAIPPQVLAIPLLVSRDGYILDGHHRWLAHVINNTACPVLRIGLPFDEAIEALFEFLREVPSGHLAKELSVTI
jgi:hypothetical protein